MIQFDNVSGALRSSRLSGLLTTTDYHGRILGSTNDTKMINDRMWTITGNNLNLGGDLPRRALWNTIDPRVPDPHLRTGFRLDIPAYLRTHRADILHALLTWVAAWTAAGQPRGEDVSSDDYRHWTPVVRGILGVAGVPGQFDAPESIQQKVGADDEGWGEFLTAVHEVFGTRAFATRDLIAQMSVGADRNTIETLTDALPVELHEKYLRAQKDAAAIKRSLGMWLRNRNGRWAGRIVCEAARHDKVQNTPVWQIRLGDEDGA